MRPIRLNRLACISLLASIVLPIVLHATFVRAQTFDSLHCIGIRDLAGDDVEAVLQVAGVEVPATCRVTARAVKLCGPAGIEWSQEDPPTREPGLVFDRLCYRVRCDDGRSQDVVVTDPSGTRPLRAKKTSLVCTPAVIGDLEDLLLRASEFGRLDARARELALSAGIDLEMCADTNGDGKVSASDALEILQVAVGTGTCLPCVCDTDMSGTFSATDALAALRFAVGLLAQLMCQEDGSAITWDGGGAADVWHDPLNWSLDTRIPNACDDVTITSGAIVTVEHSQGNNAALRVTSRFPIDFTGNGTLSVRDTVKVDNVLRFRGGTLADGTVVPGDPQAGLDTPNVLFTNSGGTLDGVTMDAPMDMTATSSFVRIVNNLILNDTASLGNNAQIQFQAGEQTFSGTGEVVFTSSGQGLVNQAANSTLTIAQDMIIRGKTGRVGSNTGTASMVNDGTIDSNEAGAIDVRGGAGWTNNGTISASAGGNLNLFDTWTNESMITITGGGTLHLDGDWTNNGTIASTGSLVELDGSFTLADLGQFDRTGGTVELEGTLDNVANLALDTTTGDWEMRGGTIMGGSVASADGAKLLYTNSGGTLDGVTMDAPMDMTATSSFVRIVNNLILNDTASLGNNAQIQFQAGDQTLSGSGEVVFTSSGQGLVNQTANSTLTIAQDMIIRGMTGRVGSNTGTASMVNNGTIDSNQAGAIDVRGGAGWTNNGTLRAGGGGEIQTFESWTNNGSIELEKDGLLDARTGLTLGGSSELSIEIGGTSTFSEIDVTGAANLGGTFMINLVDGFVPNLGDSFVVMTYDSQSGAFGTVEGQSIGNGTEFQLNFGPTELSLQVVAE